MKMKRIYYILVALAFICSCERQETHDLEVDSPRSYIFFETKVAETKANLMSGTKLPIESGTAFYVFGYRPDNTSHVFDAYSKGDNSPFDNAGVVYRLSRGADFKYDRLTLWSGGNHTFHAFYDGTERKNKYSSFEYGVIKDLNSEQTDKPYISYVQPTELAQMKDVLTATATASLSGGPVILTFEHRLFALDVLLCNGQSISRKPMIVKDAKVEFSEIPVSANIMFDNSYEASEDLCIISHDFTDAAFEISAPTRNPVEHNLNQKNASSDSFLFLPCSSIQVKFECTVVDSWEQEVTIVYPEEGYATISPEDGNGFLPGKRYELRIVKSDRDLEAICEVAAWVEKTVDMEFN